MDSYSAYVNIFKELYLKIINGEFKDGEKLPTEEELCKQYFVSRITIRKALEQLVQKGCITRRAGKGSFVTLTNNHSREKIKIGVVICNISPSYGIELLKSIEKHASESGFNIVLRNSCYDRDLEEECLKELSSDNSIKGILLQPVHGEIHNPQVLNLMLKKYPLVLIDRNLEGASLPFVGTDNMLITRKVMEMLFEAGHSDIGFFSSSPERTTAMMHRYSALSESYSKHGLVNNYSNHFFGVTSNEGLERREKIESDIEKIKEHLNKNPQLTCILCGEFTVYCLLKTALEQLSKRVPQDISIVTYDNVMDVHLQQRVSFIKQNEFEMGRIAIELLSDRISGSATDTKFYIPAEFVSMGTVKDLKP